MKIQKHVSRKTKTKTYYKYSLILPSAMMDQISWEEGDELDYLLDMDIDGNDQIILKRADTV